MKFSYGTETYYDSLGQPSYVTLMYNGVKDEGSVAPLGHATPKEAWEAYFTALNAYIADNRATAIEWRVPPQLEERDLSPERAKKFGAYPKGSQKFLVYSRLSVIERAPQ